MRKLTLLLILLAPGHAADNRYLEVVRTFVDTMMARGTDHYGPVHSPLFAAMLDLKTLELPVQSLPDDFFRGDARQRQTFKFGFPNPPVGIRPGDRAPMGNNLEHDINLLRTMYELTAITGDPKWADRAEEIAFNSLPCAMTPDLKGLHYLTAPNQIQLDRGNKAPLIENDGDMFSYNPYGYRCCQHNVSHGWPYYAEHLWMATPGNGLVAPYFVDYVRAELERSADMDLADQHGVRVYTTIDPVLQRLAEAAVVKGIDRLETTRPRLRRKGRMSAGQKRRRAERELAHRRAVGAVAHPDLLPGLGLSGVQPVDDPRVLLRSLLRCHRADLAVRERALQHPHRCPLAPFAERGLGDPGGGGHAPGSDVGRRDRVGDGRREGLASAGGSRA